MTDHPLPGGHVDLPLPPALAECWGYTGHARYVAFSWSPCGDEVVVDDGQMSRTGESQAFLMYKRHPAVAGFLRHWNLGASDTDPEYALLLDREQNRASIAPLHEARAFLEEQWPPAPTLTPEQEAEVERQVQLLIEEWRQQTVDMGEVQRRMDEQRGRVKRMLSWLDMAPEPPQEGLGHD